MLKNYLVAFIDILGFKEMVKHDSEVPDGKQKFINILYELHLETKKIKDSNSEIQVFQFSDSVVISIPYSATRFIDFCEIVSNYQYRLFLSGILCRGGVSYGKHFSSDSFLFSTGMIHAYLIESREAITPRVVISRDLMDCKRSIIALLSSKLETYQNSAFINAQEGPSSCSSPPSNNTGLTTSPQQNKANKLCLPMPCNTIFA